MHRVLITCAFALLLFSCIQPTTLPTEDTPPENPPRTEYAAYPVTLAPDQLVARRGDLLDVLNAGDPARRPLTTWVVNKRPEMTRCVRGGSDLSPDCADLERQGHILLTVEQTDLLLRDWSCEPRTGEPGAITLTSCFGLTVWQHFWDSASVQFAPPDTDAKYRVTGCGNTWVGFRLKRQAGQGKEVVHYPVDALFSDTVRISVIGC